MLWLEISQRCWSTVSNIHHLALSYSNLATDGAAIQQREQITFEPFKAAPVDVAKSDISAPFNAVKLVSSHPSASSHAQATNSLAIANGLSPGPDNSTPLDLLCVGFGPASLSIAIALSDKLFATAPASRVLPRVQFLEKQDKFAWHAGMQLSGAHMQISFLKDLATPRDPTSPFTFINYLKAQGGGRLQKFINLGTFLPARSEYEDYLRWCSSHFINSAKYNSEITRITHNLNADGKVESWTVEWKDHITGEEKTRQARHVVVATGGRPYIPEVFKPFTEGRFPRFQHSSNYATTIAKLKSIRNEPELVRKELEQALDTQVKGKGAELDADSLAAQMIKELSPPATPAGSRSASPGLTQSVEATEELDAKIAALTKKYTTLRTSLESIGFGAKPKRFVVVGGGQSAAEIYCDLQKQFPDSQVCIMIKGAALRPSDDSPFVNEVFDPERVDGTYDQDPEERKRAIMLDKATNYGVVRLELLEKIYDDQYHQERLQPDATKWNGRVVPNRTVTAVEPKKDGSGVILTLAPTSDLEYNREAQTEEMEATMVFYATGYVRDAHKYLLKESRSLLPDPENFVVDRNYGVRFAEGKVEKSAGVWLQGCCEMTHGVSLNTPALKMIDIDYW